MALMGSGGLCVHHLQPMCCPTADGSRYLPSAQYAYILKMVSSLVTSSHMFPLDQLHNALQGYVMAGSAPVNVECYG